MHLLCLCMISHLSYLYLFILDSQRKFSGWPDSVIFYFFPPMGECNLVASAETSGGFARGQSDVDVAHLPFCRQCKRNSSHVYHCVQVMVVPGLRAVLRVLPGWFKRTITESTGDFDQPQVCKYILNPQSLSVFEMYSSISFSTIVSSWPIESSKAWRWKKDLWLENAKDSLLKGEWFVVSSFYFYFSSFFKPQNK